MRCDHGFWRTYCPVCSKRDSETAAESKLRRLLEEKDAEISRLREKVARAKENLEKKPPDGFSAWTWLWAATEGKP